MARKMPRQRPGVSEQSVGTPPEFIIAACRFLGIQSFVWDLAATRDINQCAPFCFTKEDDALQNTWAFNGGWAWLNPPYSDIEPWVQKAYESIALGGKTAVLLPASVGSNWWAKWVEGKATIIPLNGRLTFVGHRIGYPKDCVLLLYGGPPPGYVNSWKWMDSLTAEEREMAKKRIGKPTKKKEPRSKIRPFKAVKAKPDDTPRLAQGGRVATFKANAPSSVQPAPEPKDIDLGAIMLPDPDDAVKVLGELAVLNDQALQAKHRWEELRERAKNAKDKYDDLAEQVLTRLQVTTHKSDLPLFNEAEREADQTRMETAASAPVVDEVPPAAPESQDESEAASEEPGTIMGSVGEESIPDEEIPF